MGRKNRLLSLSIFLLIILLGVGYAAINTMLTITGSASVVGDRTNFENNVIFESASAVASNGEIVTPTISGDNKTITFTTPALKIVNDSTTVSYKIKNGSNYGARIAVPSCTCPDGTYSTYLTVSHSRTSELTLNKNETSSIQTLTVKLKKSYAEQTPKTYTITCNLIATAIDSN